MCKFRRGRLKEELETLLRCCLILIMSVVFEVMDKLCVLMLDLLQLFRLMTYLMIDINVMLCI